MAEGIDVIFLCSEVCYKLDSTIPMLIIQIIVIFTLILLNGFFAMSEIAIIAARKTRLRQLAKKGHANAELALQLAKDPSDFLSTIQTGITFIGIIAGAFASSTLVEHIQPYIAATMWLAPYSKFLSVTIVVAIITYFSIVFGELVPKRLALNSPEKIAVLVAKPIYFLFRLGFPFVAVLSQSTRFIFRLFRLHPPNDPAVTEEDIKLLLEQGKKEGVVEAGEHAILERVLHLGVQPISSIMTPRSRMVWLNVNDPPEVLRRKIIEGDRSMFPVIRGNSEEILGVVQAKDLLAHLLFEDLLDLEDLVEKPLFILEETSALKVIEQFKRAELTIALVVDEHGSIQGLVRMSDIVEALVGELAAYSEPKLLEEKDGSWLVDGMLPIDEFKKTFNLAELPEERKGYYHTVGGFIMSHMERIPVVHNSFTWNNFAFTVEAMEGRRVSKVRVKKI